MKIKLIGLIVSLFLAFITNASAAVAISSQFSNLSTRNTVGTGSNSLILGFVIGPAPGFTQESVAGGTVSLLIRGVARKLAVFGVTNPALDPKISLYDSKGVLIIENDDWSSSIATLAAGVGAFPLDIGSKDAAMFKALPMGAYTVILTDPTSIGREALIELYDLAGNGIRPLRITNLAIRSGSTPGIVGFAVDGIGQKRVLLRVVGPSLAQFGITNFMLDPKLTVYNAAGAVIGTNDNWSVSDAGIYTAPTGAFPLIAGSKDAAMSLLITANGPVSFTYVGQDATSNAASSDKVVLLEVYEVP
jgi:hypothetical protein